jgi:toxin-antitoxin system PIN domain toxin
MRCVDVNVLVYAHREDLPEHNDYRVLLESWANDDEPLGLLEPVLTGFLRVITNRRIFLEPTASALAFDMADRLTAAPAALIIRPGERHWSLFTGLCRTVNAAGNDIADAALAACAIEQNALWLSADRGFARFPGLNWRHPLD